MRVGHLLRFAIVLPGLAIACSHTRTGGSKTPSSGSSQHEPVTVDTAHPALAAPVTTSIAQSAPANAAPPAGTASNTSASELANVEAAVLAAESWLVFINCLRIACKIVNIKLTSNK